MHNAARTEAGECGEVAQKCKKCKKILDFFIAKDYNMNIG